MALLNEIAARRGLTIPPWYYTDQKDNLTEAGQMADRMLNLINGTFKTYVELLDLVSKPTKTRFSKANILRESAGQAIRELHTFNFIDTMDCGDNENHYILQR